MLREIFHGKIHRATVTQADLHYVGSITIDRVLLDAAGILPGEKVDIYNITNGNRIATYTIPGEPKSGIIGINGAAAHHMNPGDLVIICAFGYCTTEQAMKVEPRVVLVDEHNHITEVRHGDHSVTAFPDPAAPSLSVS